MAARVRKTGAQSRSTQLTGLIHDWRSIIVNLSRILHMLRKCGEKAVGKSVSHSADLGSRCRPTQA